VPPRHGDSLPRRRVAVAGVVAALVVAAVAGATGGAVAGPDAGPAAVDAESVGGSGAGDAGTGAADGNDTATVDDDGAADFASIQAAVNAASAGDRVEVRPGTYRETVVVNASVTLVAPDGATLRGPTRDGARGPTPVGLLLTAPATVAGFRVTGYGTGVYAVPGAGAFAVREVVVAGVGSGDVSDGGVYVSGGDGSWTLRNVTVRDVDGVGLTAADATGDWTAAGLVVDNTTGTHAGVVGGDGGWTLRDARVRRTGGPAVDATGTDGNWTVANATLAGVLDATGSTGDWRVRRTTVRDARAGVGAGDSAGDWVVRNTTVENVTQVGVSAMESTGDWRLLDSTVRNASFRGVYATGATGSWAIHRSSLVDVGGAKVRAGGADVPDVPNGDATRNWWGRPSGPATGECVGNVDCGDPLPAPPAGTVPGRLVVDDDGGNPAAAFTAIQPAVDAAGDGATVEVRPGTYAEAVSVPKNVTLVAPDGATLDGSGLPRPAVAVRIRDRAAPTVAGFTVVGYDEGVDAVETAGDWTLRNLTIRGADRAVDAKRSDGDWVVRGVAVVGPAPRDDSAGVAARGATGNWTVVDGEFERVGRAIDGPETAGDWTVAEARVANASFPVFAADAGGNWTVRGVAGTDVGRLEAGGSDGAWTVADVVLRRSDGLGADDTSGDWTARNLTVVGGSFAAVSARRASGNWTVVDATLAGHATGVAAGAGEDAATGDWRVVDAAIRDTDVGVGAADAPGNWTVRRSRIVDAGRGVDATGAAGDWRVAGTSLVGSDGAAVDAGGTAGDWTLANVTVRDAGGAAVAAGGSTGDWTARGSRFGSSDAGVLARESDGDWTVVDSVVRSNRVGVAAVRSTGNWTLANVTVVDSREAGVDAGDAAGDWRVVGPANLSNNGVGLKATGTTGRWRVHRTNVTGNDGAGIDAGGADPAGNARRNWWGRPAGPADGQCVGNVTCANPLGEPARENATGLDVLLFDASGERQRPLSGAGVYLYVATPRTYEQLNELDGEEHYDGAELDDALASTTTGPSGLARLTGRRPDDYCVLVVPPETSPLNVALNCEEVRAREVTTLGFALTNDTHLNGLTDEVNAIHAASQRSITRSEAVAADVYVDGEGFFDRELGADDVFTWTDVLGLYELLMSAVDPSTTVERLLVDAGVYVTDQELDVAEHGMHEELVRRATSAADVRGTRGERGDRRMHRYAEQVDESDWLRNFTYASSRSRAVERGYETIPAVAESRDGVDESRERFDRISGRPPAEGFDRGVVERVLRAQRADLAGEGVATGLVVTPQGNAYLVDSAAEFRRDYYAAKRAVEDARNLQEVSSVTSAAGTTLTAAGATTSTTVVGVSVGGVLAGAGTALQAVSEGSYVLFRAFEVYHKNQVADRFAMTQVYLLHDAGNVRRANEDLLDWVAEQTETPTVGDVSGRFTRYRPGVDTGEVVTADEPDYDAWWNTCEMKTRATGTAEFDVENTMSGDGTAATRVVVVDGFESDGGTVVADTVATAPPTGRDARETTAGETYAGSVEWVAEAEPGHRLRTHHLYAMLVVEGRRLDVRHESFRTESESEGCTVLSPVPLSSSSRAAGDGGPERAWDPAVAYTTGDSPAGLAVAESRLESFAAATRTAVDARLGPGEDVASAVVTPNESTARVTVSLVAPTGSDVDLRVRDARGRLVGVDPDTRRAVVEVPNATYSGSDAATERVVLRSPAGPLTVAAATDGYLTDDPVPVEVTVTETPDRPAVLSVHPTVHPLEVAPGRAATTRLGVTEAGSQEPVRNGTVTAGALRNGEGVRLPRTAVTLSTRSVALAPGETTEVGVTVSPGASVTDRLTNDSRTRFYGPVTVSTEEAGALNATVAALVLDTPLANATLSNAGANVTGVHLHPTAVPPGAPARVVPRRAYALHAQGRGTLSVRFADRTRPLRTRAYAVRNGTWARLNVSADAHGVTVATAARDGTLVLTGGPPFRSAVGGGRGPPTDPDGDGLYEDVDGDGNVDVDDAVALAFVDGGALDAGQRLALDVDGDGDVDFDDAVALAFSV
jgi:pectinesterase